MKNLTTYLASGALAVALSAGAASAATVTFSALPGVALTMPTADLVTGTVFQNIADSVPGIRRSAWFGTGLDGTGLYTSVSGAASATYLVDDASTRVSFVWGSPDDYNLVQFLVGGINGVVIDSLSITQAQNILPATYGLLGATATIFSSGAFDAVRFSSSTNAFEIANLTAAIPLPAGVFLLLGALGGLAALRRRKTV